MSNPPDAAGFAAGIIYREVEMRGGTMALGAAMLGGMLLPAGAAAGAATSTGGSVHMYLTVGSNQGLSGAALFTGAIGDAGTYLTTNAAGKPDANGNVTTFTLKNGSFVINTAGLSAAFAKGQPTFDTATCSGEQVTTAPAPLSDGTGSYAGIGGSINVTETEALVMPRTSGGACSTGNTALGEFLAISGSGTVTLAAGGASAAAPTYSLLGTWQIGPVGNDGVQAAAFTVTSMSMTTGAFVGSYGTAIKVTGVEHGNQVTMTVTAGSYVAHDTATVTRGSSGLLSGTGTIVSDSQGNKNLAFTAKQVSS